MKKDYKKLSEKYKDLALKYQEESEAYAIHYDNELAHTRALLVMSGVLVQMESELISYERKNGKTDRGKLTLERLDLLKYVYDDLNGINDRNRRMKILMASNNARMDAMSQELEALKNKQEELINFNQE